MAFRLKELRLEYGITRAALSREVNISQGALANYENELRQADYNTLIILARFFEVSVDYLLGESEYESEIKPSFKPFNIHEKFVINTFRELSEDSRGIVRDLLQHLVDLERQK